MRDTTAHPETNHQPLSGIVSLARSSRVTEVHGAHQGDGAALYEAMRESDPCAAILLVDTWNDRPLHILETALLTLAGEKAVSRLGLPVAPVLRPTLASRFRLHALPAPDACFLLLARFEECLAGLPDQGFDRLLAELANNDALDIHLVIIINEQSSELLHRYQGMLPGIGEGYLRMPAELPAPADEPRPPGWAPIMPDPRVPEAHDAEEAVAPVSSVDAAAQGGSCSERSFAALLGRMSAAEPFATGLMPPLPPDAARTEPVASGFRVRWEKQAPPSRATILIMVLLAVAAIELGLLIATVRRPLPASPAALTVQAHAPGALAAATPLPQPVPGIAKPRAIAQIEPLPQIHPGSAADPKPPTSTARAVPGVYFHVSSEADRQRISAMAPALRQHGMELVGIKIVSHGPDKPDIRYFRDAEREEALRVQKALLSIGFPVHRMKHIGGMEARATPRLYEVWIMSPSGG